MARGKRFNAAEKHFESKKKQYELKIKSLEDKLLEYSRKARAQDYIIDTLSTENQQLKEWVERLLEYTELSEKLHFREERRGKGD